MSRVLIIENSPTETPVYRRLLQITGLDFRIAANNQQGVELAQKCHPDLNLMAVVMPGVNGYQATRELQCDQNMTGIPVIMITTKNQDTDRIWGMRQGAVDYMVKPVKKTSLSARVKAALKNTASISGVRIIATASEPCIS